MGDAEIVWPPRTFAHCVALLARATPENIVAFLEKTAQRENTEYVRQRLREMYGPNTRLKGFSKYHIVAESWRDKSLQTEPPGMIFVDFAYSYNPDRMYAYLLGVPRPPSEADDETKLPASGDECPIVLLRLHKLRFTQPSGSTEADDATQWAARLCSPVPKPPERKSDPRISGVLLHLATTAEGRLRLRTLYSATHSIIDFCYNFEHQAWHYETGGAVDQPYKGVAGQSRICIFADCAYDFYVLGTDFQVDYHNRDYAWVYGLLDLQQLWVEENVQRGQQRLQRRDLTEYKLPPSMDYRHREFEPPPTHKS